MAHKVRVWDLPTRLFHWALVLCMAGLLVTGYLVDAIEWHARFGYAVLTLVLFRIVWGFAGGRWSRFSSFIYPPRTIWSYLRGQGETTFVGHNPLGTLSILAILAILLVQVGTGLVSDDEIAFTGPLNHLVESARALAATSYHRAIGDWLVFGLVALHVIAVFVHLVHKKDNLIRPMVHGDKTVAQTVESSRDDAVSRLTALVILAACAGLVTWLVQLGG